MATDMATCRSNGAVEDHDDARGRPGRAEPAPAADDSQKPPQFHLWCARARFPSCSGAMHQYCHVRAPANCSHLYIDLWPLRRAVRCPDIRAIPGASKWTYPNGCAMANGSDARTLLREGMAKLADERHRAAVARHGFEQKMSQWTINRTGLDSSSSLAQRPVKKLTFADEDIPGTLTWMDGQRGSIVL